MADADVICGLMQRMELVISMRLHALIFACGQNTPIGAVAYDPKVSGFMEYLGSSDFVELEDLSNDSVRALIDSVLCAESIRGQMLRLRLLAEENGRLAGQLLAQARRS